MSTATILLPLFIGIAAGLTIISLGAKYATAPFRPLGSTRPRLALMPKYKAEFSGTLQDVRQCLQSHGFKQQGSNTNIYQRGSDYGDFSIKWMKLIAEIEPNKRQVKLGSPNMIAFDTGDVWQLLTDIVSNKAN